MEDRYLYKAKRTDNGEWVIGYYIKYGFAGNEKDYIVPEYASALYTIEIVPSTLCQCTGLKDKNDKLIWENDILRYSYDYPGSLWLAQKGLTDEDIKYSVGAVFWQDRRGTWAVCGSGKSKLTNQDIYVYSRNPNRVENIGNAIDNPELLEEEKC